MVKLMFMTGDFFKFWKSFIGGGQKLRITVNFSAHTQFNQNEYVFFFILKIIIVYFR